MIKTNKNIVVYKTAYSYLLELLPEGIDEENLKKYFVGDRRNYKSLEDIYEQIIQSAQNYQRMPNVIKFYERKERIKELLFNYNFSEIASINVEDLYKEFRKEFNVTSADSKFNCWHKWSKSICDAAKFMSNFNDVNDFKGFVKQFDYNLPTRMALPLLISTKISGVGFALACDFLKELGYLNYPKPDVHLIDVFYGLKLSEKEPISTFEAIVKMSEDCIKIDPTATPYKIDKIIWLICAGRFYLDEINIGQHKKDFINIAAKEIYH